LQPTNGDIRSADDIDAGNHPNLTMRGVAPACSLEQRSLGKGDILGLNDMYN
jgi:hypothetical protein